MFKLSALRSPPLSVLSVCSQSAHATLCALTPLFVLLLSVLSAHNVHRATLSASVPPSVHPCHSLCTHATLCIIAGYSALGGLGRVSAVLGARRRTDQRTSGDALTVSLSHYVSLSLSEYHTHTHSHTHTLTHSHSLSLLLVVMI